MNIQFAAPKTHPWAAGDYTGSAGMTFTVDLADLHTYNYLVLEKFVFVSIEIVGAAVGGVADAECRIALPAGIIASHACAIGCQILNNAARAAGYAFVAAGGALIAVEIQSGAAWTAGAVNIFIGTFGFRIQ